MGLGVRLREQLRGRLEKHPFPRNPVTPSRVAPIGGMKHATRWIIGLTVLAIPSIALAADTVPDCWCPWC